jgi:hypothetical protein
VTLSSTISGPVRESTHNSIQNMNVGQDYFDPLVVKLEILYNAVDVEHSHVSLVTHEDFEQIEEEIRVDYLHCT